MEVDLLVVNYNTKDMLERFLHILNEDYEDEVWNIYVQDNGSDDGSGEWLAANADRYKVVDFIQAENVGYAKAVNSLAKRSESDLLAAVNADTWFTTNHVKQMIKTFEDNPKQAVCGPKQVDETMRIRHGGITWEGLASGKNPVHRGWNVYDPVDALFKDRIECWTVSGSIYYVRRSVWDEMTQSRAYQLAAHDAEGAFLPTPHYFEETFCSVHAQHLGYEVWYDGTVETAGHTWHGSAPIGEPSNRFWAISRNMYVRACEMMGMEHEIR